MLKLICLLGSLISFVHTSQGSNCDKNAILVYEDLGCNPVRDKPDDPCPASYDCAHFHDFGNHCYYQSEKYNIGDTLPQNLTLQSCNVGCQCNEHKSFTCGVLDCPEWLGNPLSSPECVRKYELFQCCSVGESCPPFKEETTCEVDGKTYHEGQKFYPKDSCHVCVCQKGFQGKYEAPHCRRLSCGIELRHSEDLENHCAPVYDDSKHLCCPSLWVCGSETDVINEAATPSTEPKKCIFGEKYLKIGETIDKRIEKYGKAHAVKCECNIPPLLTCIVEKTEYLRG